VTRPAGGTGRANECSLGTATSFGIVAKPLDSSDTKDASPGPRSKRFGGGRRAFCPRAQISANPSLRWEAFPNRAGNAWCNRCVNVT